MPITMKDGNVVPDSGSITQWDQLNWLVYYHIYDFTEEGIDYFSHNQHGPLTNVMTLEWIKNLRHSGLWMYTPGFAFGDWTGFEGLGIKWTQYTAMHSITYDAVLIEDVKSIYSYRPVGPTALEDIRAYLMDETYSVTIWISTRKELGLKS